MAKIFMKRLQMRESQMRHGKQDNHQDDEKRWQGQAMAKLPLWRGPK